MLKYGHEGVAPRFGYVLRDDLSDFRCEDSGWHALRIDGAQREPAAGIAGAESVRRPVGGARLTPLIIGGLDRHQVDRVRRHDAPGNGVLFFVTSLPQRLALASPP